MGRLQAWPPGSLAGLRPLPRPPCSYLCFESSKSGSSKRNKVIKLMDITDIQKVGATPSLPSPQEQAAEGPWHMEPHWEWGAV